MEISDFGYWRPPPRTQAGDYIEKALAELVPVVDSGIDKATQTEDLSVASDFFRRNRTY